jgi:dTDP-4-dehydrorhamnose 3,5-epimerase
MKPILIEHPVFIDERGEFRRIYDSYSDGLAENGELRVEQVNISVNPRQATLRGMHFQKSGPPENKFISVLSGKIFLVVSNAHLVNSNSTIENSYFMLNKDSRSTLFVPSGLATGWISLSENVVISYVMTSRFQDCKYGGFAFNDTFANIEWPYVPNVISEQDKNWPSLR